MSDILGEAVCLVMGSVGFNDSSEKRKTNSETRRRSTLGILHVAHTLSDIEWCWLSDIKWCWQDTSYALECLCCPLVAVYPLLQRVAAALVWNGSCQPRCQTTLRLPVASKQIQQTCTPCGKQQQYTLYQLRLATGANIGRGKYRFYLMAV